MIVGVIGSGFDTETSAVALTKYGFRFTRSQPHRQGHYFSVAGRLKPGVTLAQARAPIQLSAADFRRKFPNAIRPVESFTVTPLQEAFVSNVRRTLLVLAAPSVLSC